MTENLTIGAISTNVDVKKIKNETDKKEENISVFGTTPQTDDETILGFKKTKITNKSYQPSPNDKKLTLTYGETKNGEAYTNAVVQDGELIEQLAKTYGVKTSGIKEMNKEVIHKANNTEYFVAGEKVKIPGIVEPNEKNYKKLVNRKNADETKNQYAKGIYENTEPYNGPQKKYTIQKGDSYNQLAVNSIIGNGSKKNITQDAVNKRRTEIQKLNDNKILKPNEQIIIPSNDKKDIIEDAKMRAQAIFYGLKINKSPEKIAHAIKGLNPVTVEFVVGAYNNSSNTTIIEDLLETKSLNTKEKKECLEHIVDQSEQHAKDGDKLSQDLMPNLKTLVKNYSEKTDIKDIKRIGVDIRKLIDRTDTLSVQVPESNGKIDRNFSQGNTGDCWLLAGTKSLSVTEKGQKILDESVKVNPNGSVTVSLKGVNKIYTISAQEIKGSNNFAKGDGDLRALEIATDKYFRESLPEGHADLTGNRTDKAFEVLVGKQNIKQVSRSNFLDTLIELQKGQQNTAIVTGILANEDPEDIDATVNGKKVHIYAAHAYTLSKVDDKNVYLINPHNTSETITMPRMDYLKYFNNMSRIDL